MKGWITKKPPASGVKVLIKIEIPYTDDKLNFSTYETVLTGMYFEEDGCFYEYSYTADTYTRIENDVKGWIPLDSSMTEIFPYENVKKGRTTLLVHVNDTSGTLIRNTEVKK